MGIRLCNVAEPSQFALKKTEGADEKFLSHARYRRDFLVRGFVGEGCNNKWTEAFGSGSKVCTLYAQTSES